jgi:hypothetical protein
MNFAATLQENSLKIDKCLCTKAYPLHMTHCKTHLFRR